MLVISLGIATATRGWDIDAGGHATFKRGLSLMRILILLGLGSLFLSVAGCDVIPRPQPKGKQKSVAKSKDAKSATSKPAKSFDERRNALSDEQESRFIKVMGEIGRHETRFSEASERLRDIVNEMFSNQGTVKDSADSAIRAYETSKTGPEHYAGLLAQRKDRLHQLRKNLDDAKRECPDTPAVLELYRASRDLIDGMERLIDERFAPLNVQIYDDKLTSEEKHAAAKQVRLACYQEAEALHRARLAAKETYRRDRIDQMNEIYLKKTLNPSFRPTITTIPPPTAAKK